MPLKKYTWAFLCFIIDLYLFIFDIIKSISTRVKLTNDRFSLYEYRILFNKKYYDIILTDKNHLTDFMNNIDKKIKNKNRIIHCCIIDGENDEYIMDLTHYFKKFKYYFDNNSPSIKWKDILNNIYKDEYIIYIKFDDDYEIKYNIKEYLDKDFNLCTIDKIKLYT